MENKILSICLILSLHHTTVLSQVGDTLVGVVDGELIKICHSDAVTISYQVITSIPVGSTVFKTKWCAPNDCFYSVNYDGALTDEIALVSSDASFSVKGPVTVSGGTVYHVETIDYDERTGWLYVVASLNGTAPSDYFSETLLKVDTASLVGTIVGVFSHPGTVYEPEADNIVIGEDGYFYYSETQGGGSAFSRIYKQDIGMVSAPVMIYEDMSGPNLNDITIKDGFLYFTENRDLHKIDLADNTYSTVGTMFTAVDFSGAQLAGLDWQHSVFVALDEIKVEASLDIFPNPSVDGRMEVRVHRGQILNLDVFNGASQLVKSVDVYAPNTILDLSGLAPGSYTLQASLEKGIVTRQIILSHNN